MMCTPGMIGTSVGIRLQRACEVRHRETRYAVLDRQFFSSRVKRGESRAEHLKQSCLLRNLVRMVVEPTHTCKEDLSVDAQGGPHLHNLSDLLQLKSE